MDQRNSRLILSVSLLFFVTVIGLAAAFLWRGHVDSVERAEMQAATAVDAVAAHTRWLLEAGGQTLRRVEDLPLSDDPGPALERIAADLPPGLALAIHDAEGRQVFPDAPIGVLSEEIMSGLVEDAAGMRFGVSQFLPEVAGGGGGFLIVRRLTLETGDTGLAAVHIPTNLLSDFWRALELGPDSAISILRHDGWIVARHPVPIGALNLRDQRLFTEFLPRADVGTYHSAASPADGVARIVAYRSVPDLPLVSVAAISRDHALAPYWERVWRVVLLGTPFLILLAGLAWWQARLLRREELARRQIQESAEHNHLLLREVHHRVKNNLQIILSLIRMQKLPPDSDLDLRNRIMAMSALHEHLHGSGPAGLVELGTYLREIFESVNTAYGKGMMLELSLESGILVDADIATPLGLIANELVTNANKYAYPDGRPGIMTVTLERRSEDLADLAIRNDGIPFDAEPGSKGEGIRLIRSLATQVDTDFVFSGRAGLEFTIAVPTGIRS